MHINCYVPQIYIFSNIYIYNTYDQLLSFCKLSTTNNSNFRTTDNIYDHRIICLEAYFYGLPLIIPDSLPSNSNPVKRISGVQHQIGIISTSSKGNKRMERVVHVHIKQLMCNTNGYWIQPLNTAAAVAAAQEITLRLQSFDRRQKVSVSFSEDLLL